MFKRLRILFLLLLLVIVILSTVSDRIYSTDWDSSLRVTVLPINGDGSAVAEAFVERMTSDSLLSLETFFAEQAEQYGLTLERPVRFTLGPVQRELPPIIEPGASTPRVMVWSLRLRYYSWRASRKLSGPKPDILLFVLFHDPQRSPTLPHSLGLQKGLVGVVNAFAAREMEGSNDVVIAHELLHTLGATDKYGEGNLPLHPHGFAEPDREPLYPQRYAELMGGRIPLAPDRAEIPESLRWVRIGPATAAEIGWIEVR
jgi:hypothetical protein